MSYQVSGKPQEQQIECSEVYEELNDFLWEEYYGEIYDYLNRVVIYVDRYTRLNISDCTWRSWVSGNPGRLTLKSSRGVSIERIYANLNEMLTGVLPECYSCEDMLYEIMKLYSELRCMKRRVG